MLELRALCQIIGPYGIKTMAERLTWHVSCQIIELYKIIREHAETLKMARKSYDQPEKLREVIDFYESTINLNFGEILLIIVLQKYF